MRPTSSSLSTPNLPIGRPGTDRQPEDEESAQPKPAPKRSLNEGAHKLGR